MVSLRLATPSTCCCFVVHAVPLQTHVSVDDTPTPPSPSPRLTSFPELRPNTSRPSPHRPPTPSAAETRPGAKRAKEATPKTSTNKPLSLPPSPQTAFKIVPQLINRRCRLLRAPRAGTRDVQKEKVEDTSMHKGCPPATSVLFLSASSSCNADLESSIPPEAALRNSRPFPLPPLPSVTVKDSQDTCRITIGVAAHQNADSLPLFPRRCESSGSCESDFPSLPPSDPPFSARPSAAAVCPRTRALESCDLVGVSHS